MLSPKAQETFSIPHGDNDSIVDEDENHSSFDGRSGSSKRGGDESSTDWEEQLTDRKSKAVNQLRGCVMLALIMAAFGVSITVFVLTRNADTEAFEIQYNGNVDKILNAFDDIFAQVGAISALAADATAHSQDLNTSWPFQTLSNYHGRGGNARELSGALYVSLNHIVAQQELQKWEEYVLSDANQWM